MSKRREMVDIFDILSFLQETNFFNPCRENFDNESPFHPNTSDDWFANGTNDSKNESTNSENFQESTANEFAQLIKEIKV